MEHSLAGTQKAKYRFTMWSGYSSIEYIPNKNENKCPHAISMLIFLAVLSTTVKVWKESKCPLTDKWVNKMWYTHKVKYYLAIIRLQY